MHPLIRPGNNAASERKEGQKVQTHEQRNHTQHIVQDGEVGVESQLPQYLFCVCVCVFVCVFVCMCVCVCVCVCVDMWFTYWYVIYVYLHI